MSPLIELTGVSRTHKRGNEEVHAMRDVTLTVNAGEFVVVSGPSGSGKSTLLHVMAGIETPDTGDVIIEGKLLSGQSDDEVTIWRRRRLGIVFQFFHLLPTMSAVENVMLPLLLDNESTDIARGKAVKALDRFGLGKRADHLPRQLSGGEQQRVAVARALVNDPVLVLADEPTGNLDSKAGAEVYGLLRTIPADRGATVVMVTHDTSAREIGTRNLFLRDGQIISAPEDVASMFNA